MIQDQSNMKTCHVWVIYSIYLNVHPKLDCNDGGCNWDPILFIEALPALCSPRSTQEVTLKICGLGM